MTSSGRRQPRKRARILRLISRRLVPCGTSITTSRSRSLPGRLSPRAADLKGNSPGLRATRKAGSPPREHCGGADDRTADARDFARAEVEEDDPLRSRAGTLRRKDAAGGPAAGRAAPRRKKLRPRKGSSAPSSPSARSPTASERGFIRSPTAMAGPPGCGPTGAPCATACRCSSASDHAPRDRSTPRPPPIRWPVITAPPFRSSPRGWRSGSERGRGAEWTGLPPSALCRRPPRNGSSRPSGRPP